MTGVFAALLFSAIQGVSEITLFDAGKGEPRINGAKNEIVVEGRWDLSGCDEIVAVFKDAKTHNDSFSLKLFNPGGDFKLRRGVYSARFAVARNGM